MKMKRLEAALEEHQKVKEAMALSSLKGQAVWRDKGPNQGRHAQEALSYIRSLQKIADAFDALITGSSVGLEQYGRHPAFASALEELGTAVVMKLIYVTAQTLHPRPVRKVLSLAFTNNEIKELKKLARSPEDVFEDADDSEDRAVAAAKAMGAFNRSDEDYDA